MDIEQLRHYCINKPGSEESFPFGNDTLVFKLHNKLFLLASLDVQPLRFNVKCDPEKAVALRENYPKSVLPGYHMNKKHWNTIIIDGLISSKQLCEFIDESYELVSKKKK